MTYLQTSTVYMNRLTRREVAKRLLALRRSRLFQFHQDEESDRAIDWRVLKLLVRYGLSPDEVWNVFDELYNHVVTNNGRKFAASYHDRDSFIQNQEAFIEANSEVFHAHGNPYLDEALKDLSDEMPAYGWKVTRPQSEDEVEELIPELRASAGYYQFISGKTKVYQNLKFICERLNKVIDEIIAGNREIMLEEVIITETRHQVSEPYDVDGNLKASKDIKEKTRLVWNVPKVIVIIENIFEQYVFLWLSTATDWYANGRDPVSRRNLILAKRRKYQHCYTLDASSFDLHVPGELIRLIRQQEKKMFKLSPEMEKLFDAVSWYYTHKPLWFRDSEVVEVVNGMPSGMKGTNDLDSMCFRIMIDTYMKHKGKRRNVDYSTIHDGDDVLLYFNGDIDMHDFASYLKWNFGTIIDPLKFADNDHSKRGIFFNKKYFGSIQGEYRNPKNLIARACFPEQKREYAYMKDRVRPEMIIEAYIETYPAGMLELIDVGKFRRDYHISRNSLRTADLRSLPGSVQAILKGW